MQFFEKNDTCCDWKVFFFISKLIWIFFLSLTVPFSLALRAGDIAGAHYDKFAMHNMRVTDTCKTQSLICHEEVNRCVELPVKLWKTFLLIGDNVDEGHTSSIYSIAIGPSKPKASTALIDWLSPITRKVYK